MFHYEERSYARESQAPGSPDHARDEEPLFGSSAGQKLIQDAPGQAPTVGQRFALALISLGMLMGMSTLLAILAIARNTPGWMAFSLLFVLTLFTSAVVSINVVFHRGV